MVDRVAAHVDELKKQFPDQLWIGELDLSDLANIANMFRAAVQHFAGHTRSPVMPDTACWAQRKNSNSMRFGILWILNLIGSIELAWATVAQMPLAGAILSRSPVALDRLPSLASRSIAPPSWGIEGFFDSLAQEVADSESRRHS